MEAKAILKKHPVAPRKMRRTANSIRGLRVARALSALKFQQSPNARCVEKLLLSAVANWQLKYANAKVSETDLLVKEVRVDIAPMIKRYRPAPHGRAHRIRKRANHLMLRVGVDPNALTAVESTDAVKIGQEMSSVASEAVNNSKDT